MCTVFNTCQHQTRKTAHFKITISCARPCPIVLHHHASRGSPRYSLPIKIFLASVVYSAYNQHSNVALRRGASRIVLHGFAGRHVPRINCTTTTAQDCARFGCPLRRARCARAPLCGGWVGGGLALGVQGQFLHSRPRGAEARHWAIQPCWDGVVADGIYSFLVPICSNQWSH